MFSSSVCLCGSQREIGGFKGRKNTEEVGFLCSEEMGLWGSVYIAEGSLLEVVKVRRG